VTAPGGFGNLVIQILPTVHSMDDVRKIIRIPSLSASHTVDIECDAFWNGLVAGSDLAQKSNKKVINSFIHVDDCLLSLNR